jgi:hypothetical protein
MRGKRHRGDAGTIIASITIFGVCPKAGMAASIARALKMVFPITNVLPNNGS